LSAKATKWTAETTAGEATIMEDEDQMGSSNTDWEAPEPSRVGRHPDGRFARGNNANPTGRPLGSKHKATLAAETLLEGEAEALTRKAVEMALSGDGLALRLCLERIIPPRRSRRIAFDLPLLEKPADLVAAFGAIASAMAAGELTLDEAATVVGILEAKRKALETAELERRLSALEQRSEKNGH
jgi:hypothetical protein